MAIIKNKVAASVVSAGEYWVIDPTFLESSVAWTCCTNHSHIDHNVKEYSGQRQHPAELAKKVTLTIPKHIFCFTSFVFSAYILNLLGLYPKSSLEYAIPTIQYPKSIHKIELL